MLAQLVHSDERHVSFQLPPTAHMILQADATDTVYYQVLGGQRELLGGEAKLPLPQDDEKLITQELRLRDDDATRAIWPSIVLARCSGGAPTGRPCLPLEWRAIPSRTSQLRFRPWRPFSSSSAPGLRSRSRCWPSLRWSTRCMRSLMACIRDCSTDGVAFDIGFLRELNLADLLERVRLMGGLD